MSLEINDEAFWHFGAGRIAVSVAHMQEDKSPCIILSDCDWHEIGSSVGQGDAIDCINRSARNVVLVFRRDDSLQVVLNAINECKADLEALNAT